MESCEQLSPLGPEVWDRKGTVYMVAVDAMTLDAIRPLAESGILPNFARAMAEGCHGPLSSGGLNNSGAIWTSIATGCHHRNHGIDDLAYYQMLGMRIRRPTIHVVNKLGGKGIVKGLRKIGLMRFIQFSSLDVRARTLWDIVSESGGRVGVINWVHSWPARPVNGCMASDRLQPWRLAAMGKEEPRRNGLTYPKALAQELEPLLVPPDDVPFEMLKRYVNASEQDWGKELGHRFDKWSIGSELRYALSSDLSAARVFEHCLEAFAPLNLAAVFFWGMDKVQHAAFRYMRHVGDPAVSPEDRERFGNVVPESYAFIDRLIGRLMSRMNSKDALMVVSDHGFAFEPKRGTYGHKRAQPPGVFFAYGSAFRKGCELEGVTVYDPAPTVLRLFGLPAAADMAGRCLDGALTPQFQRDNHPFPPLATYGSPDWRAAQSAGGDPERAEG